MTLLQKFSVICLVFLAAFSAAFSSIVSRSLERNALSRAEKILAEIIRFEALKEFSPKDFEAARAAPATGILDEKIKHLNLGPSAFKLKIWYKDRSVLWADEKALLGKTFLDNHELEEALRGEVEAEFSSLTKSENVYEQGVERLLELYVPVDFGNGVEAVFEVYENLDPLYQDIGEQKRLVYLLAAGGTLLAYLVLVGLVAEAGRRIAAQTKELEESEERLSSLLKEAGEGIIAVDNSGSTVFINPAAEKIFELQPDSNPPLEGFIHPLDYPKIRDELHKLSQSGEERPSTRLEAQGLRQSGRVFPLEVSLSRSGKSRESLSILFLRDLSGQKALEQQAIQAEKQATVTLVASSIGHELNNSVTTLLGFAELLHGAPSDQMLAAKAANVFLTQSRALENHAKNLLELGKPSKPEFVNLDLPAFLSEVTGMLRSSGVLKHFRIIEDYSPSLPNVRADRELLLQVFRNLEINAGHAMGDEGTLTILCRPAGEGHIETVMEDTGKGIPADFLPRIFEPFVTSKGESGGTGLGMYIARKIVSEHGGRIEVESEEGRGTRVSVLLPVA